MATCTILPSSCPPVCKPQYSLSQLREPRDSSHGVALSLHRCQTIEILLPSPTYTDIIVETKHDHKLPQSSNPALALGLALGLALEGILREEFEICYITRTRCGTKRRRSQSTLGRPPPKFACSNASNEKRVYIDTNLPVYQNFNHHFLVFMCRASQKPEGAGEKRYWARFFCSTTRGRFGASGVTLDVWCSMLKYRACWYDSLIVFFTSCNL